MITDHEKRVVAWHEAGHALVSELLPTVDQVQKVSIVPRGKALGYTLNLPQEDRYLKSRQELIDYMKVLLGGRVAEQITFGRVTTGASDDLAKVTRSPARWSTSTGWEPRSAPTRCPANDWNVSEMMRQRRDEEVTEIAEEAYRGAHQLITDHRDLLDEIADQLLVNEVIEHDEIVAIMAAARSTAAPAAAPPEPDRGVPGRASPARKAEEARPGAATPPPAPAAARQPAGDRLARCSTGSTTSAWPSMTSTPRVKLYEGVLGMPLVHRETVD